MVEEFTKDIDTGYFLVYILHKIIGWYVSKGELPR